MTRTQSGGARIQGKGGAIAVLIIALVLTGCREVGAEDELEDSLRAGESSSNAVIPLQTWSAAQTQGKLQPFPSRTTAKLQRVLNRAVGKDQLPGAVLYIATSDGVWTGSAGEADLKTGSVLKPTDRFRTGSLSELYLAVVCLQLAEAGQLELDRRIGDYLPKDVMQQLENSQSLTVRQLLNHTSGLAHPELQPLQQSALADPKQNWTAKQVLSFLPKRERAVPQSTFFHSSANYLLLELIVEQVTQRSLVKELRDRLLAPLKLNNTFLERREPIPDGFVQIASVGDRPAEGKTVLPPIEISLGLGNKGIVSNAPDLARFFQSLFDGKTLISASSLKQMLTLAEDGREGYGLGIRHTMTPWGEAWGQTGQTGSSSVLLYLPVHDLTIVAWTNDGDRRPDAPGEIVEKSLDIILGDPP